MSPTDHARRPWVRPTIARLPTGEAEIAPRVDNSDGSFTRTS